MGGWLQLGGSQRGGNPAQFRKARKHLGLFVGGQAPLRATLPSSESDGFVCCSKAAETARSELIFLDPHGRARIVGPAHLAARFSSDQNASAPRCGMASPTKACKGPFQTR